MSEARFNLVEGGPRLAPKALSVAEQIRFVQIETGTACNYGCLYCPVAYFPRRKQFLELATIAKIIDQLSLFPNLQTIYLNGYDEPTLNVNLVRIIRLVARLGIHIVLFTNATGLTPRVADAIAESRASIEFDIHLSTSNRRDFEKIHQSRLFERVMVNIRHLRNFHKLYGIKVCISAQAPENPEGDRLCRELEATFAGSGLPTFRWIPNDRAGLLAHTEYNLQIYKKNLRGCSLQNRTSEWIHINATGNVILCCQDYFETHVLGNVEEMSLVDILSSEWRGRLHDWTIGVACAPDDYMCRRCKFAISD